MPFFAPLASTVAAVVVATILAHGQPMTITSWLLLPVIFLLATACELLKGIRDRLPQPGAVPADATTPID